MANGLHFYQSGIGSSKGNGMVIEKGAFYTRGRPEFLCICPRISPRTLIMRKSDKRWEIYF
jgi:hypothetical protein